MLKLLSKRNMKAKQKMFQFNMTTKQRNKQQSKHYL